MRLAKLISYLVLTLGLASQSSAITLGMTDTFEAGADGWSNGSGLLGTAADNGPSAAGGSALEIIADGGGTEGRIVGFNAAQWAGDFAAAGVTAISVDLNNVGASDLTIRLSFRGPSGVNDTYTTDGLTLSAGSGWQTTVFDISASGLHDVLGSDAAAALADIAQMRIVHSPGGGFGGGFQSDGGVPFVVGTLRVDNITAIPEPSTAWLVVGGLLGLGALRSRRAL